MSDQIESLQNPLVKHFVKLRQDRAYRYEQQSIVVDGIKPIQELSKTITPKVLLSTKEYPNATIVNESVMKKISGMESPEGLIAEFPMPKQSPLDKMQLIMALDGLQDPGNMGTLIRTALAFGWQGVFILNNSCDPYNDKAIRAARGATFRLPLRIGSWDDLHKIATQNQMEIYAADITGKPIDQVNKTAKILVLGNEAHGISKEAMEHCERVTIPMAGNMESLNVAIAGGILLYLLQQE